MLLNRIVTVCLFALISLSSYADGNVIVSKAWVKATVPGQPVGAAYMRLQSDIDTKLVAVENDASDKTEMHSMTMNDGVMQMRALENIALVAGKQTKLEPGGLHLMLLSLKKPLQVGESVTFTLHFKNGNGSENTTRITVPIQTSYTE
ncbi:hypothetical protein A7981_02510 [Methylovorus sp. MM2]|uniref:copper chaperone PCu(A)C n=1 Tax=Methylovorus sp. MM2 TaxID=1848038 RepID=UPI0007E14309|nr:copper chaperone PCu(A)C [Methylovorus sp. MM2]OAM52374.1 hypothetical protein A7981_02510 [Methylovorus sp. MM2]